MLPKVLAIFVALAILGVGETLKNDTKNTYKAKGYSWRNVVLFSNLAGLIGGLLVLIVTEQSNISAELNPASTVFAGTVFAYILIQSFMTDLRILLINRKILRVAYITMYILALYNIFTVEAYKVNWLALVVYTFVLFGLFLFSSIGASDVRAMAVCIPFSVSIGGYTGIKLLVIGLLIIALAMLARNFLRDRKKMIEFKKENAKHYKEMNKPMFFIMARNYAQKDLTPEQRAMPVGPYMIIPFMIYIVAFPFF